MSNIYHAMSVQTCTFLYAIVLPSEISFNFMPDSNEPN